MRVDKIKLYGTWIVGRWVWIKRIESGKVILFNYILFYIYEEHKWHVSSRQYDVIGVTRAMQKSFSYHYSELCTRVPVGIEHYLLSNTDMLLSEILDSSYLKFFRLNSFLV